MATVNNPNEGMDVDMDMEVEKEVAQEVGDGNSLPPIADDIIIEDPPPLPNTSSPIPGTETGIKTVTSSSVPVVVVDVPLIKQLPPTPSSPNIPSSPLPPQQQQPPKQQQPPPPPPPPLQHQSSTLKPPTSVEGDLKLVPQGATLDIGIPCIIASKRKRFKAYARYIGEVQGESGGWVWKYLCLLAIAGHRHRELVLVMLAVWRQWQRQEATKFMGEEEMIGNGVMERGVGYNILRLEVWEDLNGIMVVVVVRAKIEHLGEELMVLVEQVVW
jgi:hypothetical protein